MKVSDLEGALLDYWVAKAEGSRGPEYVFQDEAWHATDCGVPVFYSRRWEQGGPIIDREQISTWRYDDAYGDDFPQNLWFATVGGVHGWDDGSIVCNAEMTGGTALTAAMRAYIASKFGEEVPDENISEKGLHS